MKTFSEARPSDGQVIEVKFPNGVLAKATYYQDGIDGIVVDEDGDTTEIDEHGNEMLWGPME